MHHLRRHRQFRRGGLPGVGQERLERRPAGFQTRDGNSKRGAGHVAQAGVVKKVDGLRVAAVLPADPDLEVGLSGPAFCGGDLHQAADTVGVEGLER